MLLAMSSQVRVSVSQVVVIVSHVSYGTTLVLLVKEGALGFDVLVILIGSLSAA